MTYCSVYIGLSLKTVKHKFSFFFFLLPTVRDSLFKSCDLPNEAFVSTCASLFCLPRLKARQVQCTSCQLPIRSAGSNTSAQNSFIQAAAIKPKQAQSLPPAAEQYHRLSVNHSQGQCSICGGWMLLMFLFLTPFIVTFVLFFKKIYVDHSRVIHCCCILTCINLWLKNYRGGTSYLGEPFWVCLALLQKLWGFYQSIEAGRLLHCRLTKVLTLALLKSDLQRWPSAKCLLLPRWQSPSSYRLLSSQRLNCAHNGIKRFRLDKMD